MYTNKLFVDEVVRNIFGGETCAIIVSLACVVCSYTLKVQILLQSTIWHVQVSIASTVIGLCYKIATTRELK